MARSRSQKSRRRPGRTPQARANRHAAGGPVARMTEEELYELAARSGDDILLLILDGVQDPHNLGACLRTADAAGVAAIITPRHHKAPVTETVVRVACGAASSIPVVAVTNLARCLDRLREESAGLRIVGTADEAREDLYECDFTGPIAIALGAEGEGLRRLTGEKCDQLIRIPMLGEVECLNVSNAAAVCLFEAVRQRKFGA